MRILLALLIASTPGLVAWWSGRRLVRRYDHPLFSELLLAHSGRVGRVFLLAWIATLLLGMGPGMVGFAVALVAVLVGSFPSRRRIFAERWGLPAYLGHHLRVLTAFVGPWILIVFAPALLGVLARHGNGPPWIAAIGAVVLTMLWSIQSRALLGLVGAIPIADTDLRQRFDEVLRRSRCKRPRILHAGAPGGLWVNGWALPNPSAPAILLTDGLLRALEPEETTAIFAHEVAHLEEFTTRRWLLRTLVPAALVFALAALLTIDATSASVMRPLLVGWPVVVLVALAMSMSRAQSHETASDLRAVELTGDPEALVRALTKIHALTRQPRRLPSAVEARATHPSLARRIQAIRTRGVEAVPGAAVDSQASGAVQVLVRSADDERAAVAMLSDRLVWIEGREPLPPVEDRPVPEVLAEAAGRTGQTNTLRYAQIAELRVDATNPERPKLVVVAQEGNKRTLPLQARDVERLQGVLDVVDSLLGRRPNVAANPITSSTAARLAAVAAALAGCLPPWNGALVLAGLVALVWPARTTLVSAAVAGLVGVAATWLRSDASNPMLSSVGSLRILLGLQALTSVVVLVLVGLRACYRTPESPRAQRHGLAVLLLLALLACVQRAGTLTGPLPEMQLHLWARSTPTLLVLLAGSAAGLVVLGGKRTRKGAAALLLAAITMASFGSHRFRDGWTRDLLRPTPPALAAQPRALELLRTTHFAASVAALELSPAGCCVAVQLAPDSRRESAPPYFVVDGPQSRRTVEGRLLRWADERTVVTVSSARSGIESLVVRQVDLVDGERTAVTCPGLLPADLQVRGGRWWVVSPDRSEEQIVECSGMVGTREFVVRRWTLPHRVAPGIVETASDGRGNVLTSARAFPEGLSFASLIAAPAQPAEQVWIATRDRLRKLGETALFPIALRPSPWEAGFVCLATTLASTEVWEVDAHRGAMIPRGRLAGSWYWAHTGGDVVLERWGSPHIVVAAAPDCFYSVQCDSLSGATCAERSSIRHVAARRDRIAIARTSAGQTDVTIYEVVPASADE